MHPYLRNFIFLVFLTPLILIGYQNCAGVKSQRVSKQSDHSFTKYGPISFTTSITPIGYQQGNCNPSPINDFELFNPNSHICATAQNTCELAFLMDNGFSDENLENCESSTNFESSSLNETFTDAAPQDFGYQESSDNVCSFQFERLVNIEFRKCVNAKNGCEISFLKQNTKFISDQPGFCQ